MATASPTSRRLEAPWVSLAILSTPASTVARPPMSPALRTAATSWAVAWVMSPKSSSLKGMKTSRPSSTRTRSDCPAVRV
nr:hypothetical protein [Corallococcus macrosporus]